MAENPHDWVNHENYSLADEANALREHLIKVITHRDEMRSALKTVMLLVTAGAEIPDELENRINKLVQQGE